MELTSTQIITIDPGQYVTAVYAPFRERLAMAKAAADGVTGMDVKTKDGMALAVKHRSVFRKIRLEAESARVERKAPILTISKLIDGTYKELEKEIAEYESAFDRPIKDEESRLAYERVAAARAEQARIDAEEKAKRDAYEASLAAERAELDRQRAELAKAEQARLEAEKQARLKIEQEERAARERIEAIERKARLEREAEERRMRDEQANIDIERRAIEAQRQQDAEELKRRAISINNPNAGATQTLIGASHEAESSPVINSVSAPAPMSPQTKAELHSAVEKLDVPLTGINKLLWLISQETSDFTPGELQQVLDAAREIRAARRERATA